MQGATRRAPPPTHGQYKLYLENSHYTKDRFFPLGYIKAVLELDDPMMVTMDTTVEDIVRNYEDRVSYSKAHAKMYAQVEVSHQALCNWQADDFETVCNDKTVVGSESTKVEVAVRDKSVLQMYGRPYDESGKPTGTYYRYARVDRVPEWNDLNSREFSQSYLDPSNLELANSRREKKRHRIMLWQKSLASLASIRQSRSRDTCPTPGRASLEGSVVI